MKKTITALAAIALTCAAASSFAQSAKAASFTGWGVGATVSAVNNAADLRPNLTDLAASGSEVALSGSYGYAMGGDWIGTAGLTIGLVGSDFGSYMQGGTTSTAKIKNHYSVSFAPGYRLGDRGLIYGKVAYHQADVNYTATSGFDLTTAHRGTGVGIGYAMAMSDTLELRGEYEFVKFDTQNTSASSDATPHQGRLNVSLFYKF